jgi:hypothetical protein
VNRDAASDVRRGIAVWSAGYGFMDGRLYRSLVRDAVFSLSKNVDNENKK